jgi:hypothetical protein
MPNHARHPSFEDLKFLIRQIKGWTPLELSTKSNCLLTGRPMAIRGPDEFCGEGALSGELLRLATVTALTTSEIVRPGKRRRDSVRRDGCNSISAGCRARPRAPAFVTVGARQEETNGSVSLLMKLAKQEARASAWQSKLQSNHGTCGGEIPEHSCQVVFQ